MKKDLFSMIDKLNLPEEVINELILLQSIGVSLEDLGYILARRLNEY